jgi:hypothetical protein
MLVCILRRGGNRRDFDGCAGAERQFFFSRIGHKSRGFGATPDDSKCSGNDADIQPAGLVNDDAAIA